MEKITATAADLMRQAPMTVMVYLREVVEGLDCLFNEPGYAKAHPELVGTLVQACVADLHTSALTSAVQDVSAAIDYASDRIDEVASSVAEHEGA